MFTWRLLNDKALVLIRGRNLNNEKNHNIYILVYQKHIYIPHSLTNIPITLNFRHYLILSQVVCSAIIINITWKIKLSKAFSYDQLHLKAYHLQLSHSLKFPLTHFPYNFSLS